MSIKADIIDLLEKQGYRVQVEDDNVNNALMITTDRPIPQELKELVELIRPPQIVFHFNVKERMKYPVPTVLHKWYKETMKANK